MKFTDLINGLPEEAELVAKDCYFRAGILYEKSGDIHNSLISFLESGDIQHAADLYKERKQFSQAAGLYIKSGDYHSAMECFMNWQLHIAKDDIVSTVKFLLGISACLKMMTIVRGSKNGIKFFHKNPMKSKSWNLKLSPFYAVPLNINKDTSYFYRMAIELINKNKDPRILGLCWEAVGDYGKLTKRDDIVQIGYEKAISNYSEQYNAHRLLVAKKYLSAVHNNYLLILDIQERFEKWSQNINYEKDDRVSNTITNSIGMEFVYIPHGTFMMGSRENDQNRKKDETLHRVTLTQDFYMQTTTVTIEQWKLIMGNIPIGIFLQHDFDPVTNVTWYDVQDFIKKLNQRENLKYRLPTEAEWEYACRAGTESRFYFGDHLKYDQAVYKTGEYEEMLKKVGTCLPNAWGLYDMHGHVEEWCSDKCGTDYNIIITDTYIDGIIDPICSKGKCRICRGGSIMSYESECRSAARKAYGSAYKSDYNGFRLVLENPLLINDFQFL